MTDETKSLISARIPNSLHRDLIGLADQTGSSLTELVVTAIAAYLEHEIPKTLGDRVQSVEARLGELEKKLSGLAR